MTSRLYRLYSWIEEFLDVNKQDRLKVFLLALIYGLIIGAYTIARELKNSIFMNTVGRNWIPGARWLSMIVLLPAILGYSSLVDRLRRYQLLCVCAVIFGCIGLFFTFFLGHSTIGLVNTKVESSRLLGWLFYFFVEAFSPFLVSVMWAFSSSITDPDEAKRGYPLMVAGSKLGGIVFSGLAWFLCSRVWLSSYNARSIDIINYQIMLGLASVLLLLVPCVIMILVKKVPARYLHGYESVYRMEKKAEKKISDQAPKKISIFAGLFLLIRYPYVRAIFGMVFFYEVIDTILSFLRIGIAHELANTLSQEAVFLFETAFQAHMVGLFFSIFGTKTLLRLLGERICLLLIPLLIGSALLVYMIWSLSPIFMVVTVLLKAIHYAFSMPVRESLYIPTVNEIKFKSKSWIDAFGGKFARATGSIFNFFVVAWGGDWNGVSLSPAYPFIFSVIIGCWFITAYFLGREFEYTIKNNKIIGS